jgi:hypothetical protein
MISVPDGDEGPCHTVPPGNTTKGTVVLLDGLRLMTVFVASEVLRVDSDGMTVSEKVSKTTVVLLPDPVSVELTTEKGAAAGDVGDVLVRTMEVVSVSGSETGEAVVAGGVEMVAVGISVAGVDVPDSAGAGVDVAAPEVAASVAASDVPAGIELEEGVSVKSDVVEEDNLKSQLLRLSLKESQLFPRTLSQKHPIH